VSFVLTTTLASTVYASSGCEYGDVTPDDCKQYVTDETIKTRCAADDSNCCATCASL